MIRIAEFAIAEAAHRLLRRAAGDAREAARGDARLLYLSAGIHAGDGALDIEFRSRAGWPTISGLEIVRIEPAAGAR